MTQNRLDQPTGAGQSILDTLGILNGTDKSSLAWDYLRHYERELAPFRDHPMNVLEIGVAGGGSLETWSRFFPLATVIGVDINPSCKASEGPRKIVEIGSQADPAFLDYLVSKYKPSIIIDDGSHLADHIKITFDALFPHLAPGGCYIIEDLHFHFHNHFVTMNARNNNLPPQSLLTGLANKVLAAEYRGDVAAEEPDSLTAQIDRVVYIPRAALVWKKTEAAFLSQLDRWEALATESRRAWNWEAIAKAILSQNGPLDRAEAAARKSVSLAKKTGSAYEILGRVLEKIGKYDEAAEAFQTAIDLCQNNPQLVSSLTKRRAGLLEKVAG